jgi:hypothetical protein
MSESSVTPVPFDTIERTASTEEVRKITRGRQGVACQ